MQSRWIDIGPSAFCGLAVLCAALAYWFAETLLVLFVVMLPPVVFIAGVVRLIFKL